MSGKLEQPNENLEQTGTSIDAAGGIASKPSRTVRRAAHMSAGKVQLQDGTWKAVIRLKDDAGEMMYTLAGDDAQLLTICRALLDLQAQVKQLNRAGH